MKAMILAAGLGTRLKPLTDKIPKALVEVKGVPVLERAIVNLKNQGFKDIVVNVHHFADQIIDFIKSKGWNIKISDERPRLLETGGAILHAAKKLEGDESILVHNADILSNAEFGELENAFTDSRADAALLVSPRESSRKLVFDSRMELKGWHSLKTDSLRPVDFKPTKEDQEFAFSGIYVLSPLLPEKIKKQGYEGKFSIMDYLLETLGVNKYTGILKNNLRLIDIGKPETLEIANELLKTRLRI